MPSLTDWTQETGVTCTVDASRKYAGNSSFKITTTDAGKGITRGSNQQARIILWNFFSSIENRGGKLSHLSYGAIALPENHLNIWFKYRCTFWYDSANGTKWGRLEEWDSGAWVQIGNDTNFGSGSPSSNPIRLGVNGANGYTWYDDIEVYGESV